MSPDAPITPWPAPASAPAIIVGGTFDPPHAGHVELPAVARDRLLGDAGWLVYVPAARSPHKSESAAASDAERIEMLELALDDVPNAAVWTDELDRAAGGEPSYTADTIARARELLGPDADLRFIVGADQALAFHRWREPRRIIDLAEPVVLLREPIGDADVLRRSLTGLGEWDTAELERWCSRAIDVGTIDVSATAIRKLLAEGGVPRGLHPRVATFIAEHGLYRCRS